MRTIAAVIVSLALAVPAFAETTPAPPVNQGLEAGNAISSSYINLVYTPVKVVVAAVGAVVGGVAGVLVICGQPLAGIALATVPGAEAPGL